MAATAARSLLLPRPLHFLPPPNSEITITTLPFYLPSFYSPKTLKSPRVRPLCCVPPDAQDSSPSQDLAILLEVEGVLADVYRSGNREAFNIGWPTSLPTNEKETFMKNILRAKQKALEEFVASNSVPLRPGVENFIDDALKEGIPEVMLTAYSKNGEQLSRSVIEELGTHRVSSINIVGKEEVEGSFYGLLMLGKGVSSSLDEQLVKEARKSVSMEKQRIAKEVASVLKLSVDLGPSTTDNLEKIVATLRAGAEYAGLSVNNCVLVAGSQSGVLGAERIGMPCVVLRSSLTARAEFRGAKAVMDGFGGGLDNLKITSEDTVLNLVFSIMYHCP